MLLRLGLTVLAVPLAASCIDSGEFSESAWSPEDAWAVEEVLSVGGLDAAAEYQFGEIVGIDVDAAGNIYVADRQAQNVRVFDAAGEYLRVIGQPGEGPGEFGGNIRGVFIIDDEVVVPDPSSSRVTHFGLDGVFITTEPINMAQGVPIRWDVAMGRLVAQRRLRVSGDRAPSAGDAIVTLDSEAQSVDTIATLPPGQSVQITGGLPKIVQFEPEPVWDITANGRIVTAMTSEWRFEVRNAAGELEWVAMRPSRRERVSERQREAVRNSLREMYRSQGVPPRLSEEVIDRMEFAEYLPALAAVSFGPYDSLWVQGFTPPDEFEDGRVRVLVQDMGSLEWGVFDCTGLYLGTVAFPIDFRPIWVVDDKFYGIARDEFDVQTVSVVRVVTQ